MYICAFFFSSSLSSFLFGLRSPVGCDIQVCIWCGGVVIRVGGCKGGLCLPELSLPLTLALVGSDLHASLFLMHHISAEIHAHLLRTCACICMYIYIYIYIRRR